MKNKLSVSIMAHKKRKHFVLYLKEKLGDVPVIWDRKNNLWDTCRRAWLAYDKDAEFHCVIQDDALVTNDFYFKAKDCLLEECVMSFYLSRLVSNKVELAIKKGDSFVESTMIFNEVAICIPTKYIKEMVKYCDDRDAQNDQFITKWAKEKRLRILYPIPSLVSHRSEEPSIYREVSNKPQPTTERKAIHFYE